MSNAKSTAIVLLRADLGLREFGSLTNGLELRFFERVNARCGGKDIYVKLIGSGYDDVFETAKKISGAVIVPVASQTPEHDIWDISIGKAESADATTIIHAFMIEYTNSPLEDMYRLYYLPSEIAIVMRCITSLYRDALISADEFTTAKHEFETRAREYANGVTKPNTGMME